MIWQGLIESTIMPTPTSICIPAKNRGAGITDPLKFGNRRLLCLGRRCDFYYRADGPRRLILGFPLGKKRVSQGIRNHLVRLRHGIVDGPTLPTGEIEGVNGIVGHLPAPGRIIGTGDLGLKGAGGDTLRDRATL